MTLAEVLFGTVMIAMLALGTSRLIERRYEDRLRAHGLGQALALADEVRRRARAGEACGEIREFLQTTPTPGLWRWKLVPPEADRAPAWVVFTPVASLEAGFPVYVGSCR